MTDEKRDDQDVEDKKPAGEADAAGAPDSEPAIDPADPAAIARRVAALGEDDESEAFAREEERKLAERRAAGRVGKKGKKKKGGLETAASKKLSGIGTRAEPKRTVAVASDADPLIEKTAKLSEWAKENQKVVQIVGAALTLVLIGIAGYLWWDHKRENEASVLLSKAIEAQQAPIGEPPKGEEEAEDEGPRFKTYDARRDATLEKYRQVAQKFPGTGAAILARLAEASLLLDKRDADGAIAAYNDVKRSPLAMADKEVQGRALEGLGFANELKSAWDPALGAYKELEGVELPGFKELALYHQARVHESKGDKAKAKELLVELKGRFDKPEDRPASGIPAGPAFPYLKEVAMDRLRAIDPEAAPKMQGAPGGGAQLLPAQIKKMLEDQQKKQGGH